MKDIAKESFRDTLKIREVEKPTVKSMGKKVSEMSTIFEKNNTETKRIYLLRNVRAFEYLVSKIDCNEGCFGTGYPFYALGPYWQGDLPEIKEQYRYNDELEEETALDSTIWTCEDCLKKNAHKMPDLKVKCNPCKNVSEAAKPRKLINRLPDIDMWMVCKDGHVEEAQEKLSKLLEEYDIKTSDVDPVQTMEDVNEIVEQVNQGIIPNKFLPIDAHIIEHSELKRLIKSIPQVLEEAEQNNEIPYIAIKPYSYRKTWNKDEKGYNFINDFLSSFTERNFVGDLEEDLREVRSKLATKYSLQELYEKYLLSAPDSAKRRNKTMKIIECFRKRYLLWKEKAKDYYIQNKRLHDDENEK